MESIQPAPDGAWFAQLRPDCGRCRGLCCTELYFWKSEGFPRDKDAGTPCVHLGKNFSCNVHADLPRLGLRGCLAYECFGAGQRASAQCPAGDRRIRAAFEAQYRLHEMLWYLGEAASLACAEDMLGALRALASEGERVSSLSLDAFLDTELDGYQARVNTALKEAVRRLTRGTRPRGALVGRDLRKADVKGIDFCMELMMAANLSGCVFRGCAFLGADLRDADLRDADLRESAFLTQRQINAAKGNAGTKLPAWLARPRWWTE